MQPAVRGTPPLPPAEPSGIGRGRVLGAALFALGLAAVLVLSVLRGVAP